MSDFVVENGVLKQYAGSKRSVVVPEGVTEIAEDEKLPSVGIAVIPLIVLILVISWRLPRHRAQKSLRGKQGHIRCAGSSARLGAAESQGFSTKAVSGGVGIVRCISSCSRFHNVEPLV